MLAEWIEEKKVLLTEGDWTLELLDPRIVHTGFNLDKARYISFVKHKCDPNYMNIGWKHIFLAKVVVYPDNGNTCWRCNKEIPDKLIVCWTFQNWDKIEHRKSV